MALGQNPVKPEKSDRFSFLLLSRVSKSVTFPLQNVLHPTARRNEYLARRFHDPKLMECEGSGFYKIFQVLLSQGGPAPELIETHDRAQVTAAVKLAESLYDHGLKTSKVGAYAWPEQKEVVGGVVAFAKSA